MTEDLINNIVEWSLKNPSPGNEYAGWRKIRQNWECSRATARKAAKLAREALESEEGTKQPSITEVGLMREMRTLKQQLQQFEELEEVFRSVIQEAVSPLPPWSPSKSKKSNKKKAPCCLMLEASDWQIGMKVNEDDTMHFGGYDYETFKERLDSLFQVICTVYEEQSSVRPVDRIVVNFLGDILEGVSIFKSQAWFLDFGLVEQFFNALNDISTFIRELAKVIPEVTCYSVWGNHGRIGRKGEYPDAQCNAEYLLFRCIQDKIRGIENANMYVSKTPILAYKLFDEVHLLAHGDKTRQWNQIPFYGLTRDTMRYMALTRLPIRYAHYGHHHRNADWHESATQLLVNGSLCGPTEYSVDEIKSAEPASQDLYLVHPDHGVNWCCPIRFTNRTDLELDPCNLYTPTHK